MSRLQRLRHRIPPGCILLLILLATSLQLSTNSAYAATASAHTLTPRAPSHLTAIPANPEADYLRQQIRAGKLASTVHVLDTFAPTTILQFPLVPSGIKSAFPGAKGLVTIVRGSRNDSTSDTVTLDVEKMPPNVTFTVFFIQFAGKPFGNVQYVADLTTRGDGSGETVFRVITFVSFAMDAHNPGTSQDDKEGLTSGTNLEHLGMWFSSLQVAQQVLNDETLKGTIFDGGNPPLHAGPQAMTDGQTAPVF